MNAITMDSTKLAKQAIGLQKSMFNNTYDAMMSFQEQAEKRANTFLDQAPWIPEEGKKAINDWVKAYNKGCTDYKKMITEGFDNMEKFFAEAEKKEMVKKTEKRAPAKEPERKESAKSK